MESLLQGLLTCFEPYHCFLIAIGCFAGIIVGAIPGLTAMMALVLLLPLTFTLHIVPSLCLLLGIYVGGISGGFISACLLGIPGTPSSMATTFDGFPMVKKGEHEKALGLSLLSSCLGGLFSGICLILLSPQLASFAIHFGPYEYFALVLFTFSCVSSFSEASLWKPYLAAALGFIGAMVGMENSFGIMRFTAGISAFYGGLTLVACLIGMFALPQIFSDLNTSDVDSAQVKRIRFWEQVKAIYVIKDRLLNLLRSALIGTGIGILPGVGPGLSNVVSYIEAKRASKHPETFGTGEPDGVIASETANNASTGGALIPLITLGIPGDGCTMILLGAFLLNGLQPGPLMFRTQGELINLIFAAFMVSTVFVLIMQLSLMNLYTKLLTVQKHFLFPPLLVCCVMGCFALNSRLFDSWTFLVAGLCGVFLLRLQIPLLPVLLGLILGPMAERNFRIALDIGAGDIMPFFTRPVSCIFLIAAAIFFLLPFIRAVRRKKAKNAAILKEAAGDGSL